MTALSGLDAFAVHAPVVVRRPAAVRAQQPVVASAEWVAPAAQATVAVLSVAGLVVTVGTGCILASSAEFIIPMTVGRMPPSGRMPHGRVVQEFDDELMMTFDEGVVRPVKLSLKR